MNYNNMVKKYKALIKKNMVSLDIYKPEFDTLIDVYAGMLAEYNILTERLIESDFDIEVETQRGGTRKSATATAQEKLRADLISYSDRLMLNPKTLQPSKVDSPKKESVLNRLLETMERG